MKTILTILLTLAINQYLVEQFGPRNPAARLGSAASGSVRWFLHSAFDMVE
ncbi:MAG: hypothetical protein U1F71_00165 [Verrucomicrobiaceae bacterium]